MQKATAVGGRSSYEAMQISRVNPPEWGIQAEAAPDEDLSFISLIQAGQPLAQGI